MGSGRGPHMSIRLTRTPLGFFSGSTCRMSMLSITVLFVEFRLLRSLTRRRP